MALQKREKNRGGDIGSTVKHKAFALSDSIYFSGNMFKEYMFKVYS